MTSKLNSKIYLLFVIVIAACSNDKPAVDAKTYFNGVITKTDSVVTVFNRFIDGSTYFQVDSMNAAIVKIKSTIDEKAAALANMEDYNGDASLRISAITFISQLNEVSNAEFKQMVIVCAASESMAEDVKSNKIDSLASLTGLRLNMASKPFLKSQVEFAGKNNMKLNFDYEIAPVMKKELDTTVLVK